MHEAEPQAAESRVGVKPPGIRELTPRSVACGLLVALVMGASYPYVVLKLGFGPNVSVVAAFFGFLALGLFSKTFNRWENNIVQTAGTAAAQTAFMCVLLAAFDLLGQSQKVSFHISLSPLQSFLWLSSAGLLGVLLAVPLRQHFIVDEKLTYADGVAAGETLIVLDSRGEKSRNAALAMAAGTIASALLMLMTEDALVLKLFPSEMSIREAWEKLGLLAAHAGEGAAPAALGLIGIWGVTRVGVSWSLLSAGSGMLIGMRINLSMLLGAATSWAIAPVLLLRAGILPAAFTRNDVLFWVMWPATGMLVAGGLTALVLKWNVLMRTFHNLRTARASSDEFPLSWVAIGVAASSAALIAVQHFSLGLEVWVTVVAILLSLPLMLVGLRVLGETNWGPISALSNMMQGVFAFLAPGHIPANMLASGTTGTIAVESEAIMQDFKAGHMIGSSPRALTIMQLLATPVGAFAVSWMYPQLAHTYGIGTKLGLNGQVGLSSPISVKWKGFAEILSQGVAALPPGAVTALLVGSAIGVILTVMEGRGQKWVPSPTGVGIGMLVPFSAIFTMMLGGLADWIWKRRSPATNRVYMTPLASGLIAGEAIIAVIVPLLVVLGIVTP